MRCLVSSLVIVGAITAITTSAAFATANRTEYGIEVSIICEEAASDEEKAFTGLFKGRGGIGSIAKVFDRLDDLYEQKIQNIASVPPAPGDEALAGSWLAVMHRIAILNDRSTALLKDYYRKFKPLIYRALKEDEADLRPSSAAGRKQMGRMEKRFTRLARKTRRATREDERLARELQADGCVSSDPPFFSLSR